MEIINKNVNDLKPYKNNPRFNDNAVKYVAKSIKEFGFKVPIVVDKNNVIVAGHTRYKASKELGLKEVPCIVADDLTDEQIKAFRLADNKVSEISNWDYTKLAEELTGLDKELMEQFDFMDFEFVDDNVEVMKEEKEKEDKYYKCPNCQKEINEKDLIECK